MFTSMASSPDIRKSMNALVSKHKGTDATRLLQKLNAHPSFRKLDFQSIATSLKTTVRSSTTDPPPNKDTDTPQTDQTTSAIKPMENMENTIHVPTILRKQNNDLIPTKILTKIEDQKDNIIDNAMDHDNDAFTNELYNLTETEEDMYIQKIQLQSNEIRELTKELNDSSPIKITPTKIKEDKNNDEGSSKDKNTSPSSSNTTVTQSVTQSVTQPVTQLVSPIKLMPCNEETNPQTARSNIIQPIDFTINDSGSRAPRIEEEEEEDVHDSMLIDKRNQKCCLQQTWVLCLGSLISSISIITINKLIFHDYQFHYVWTLSTIHYTFMSIFLHFYYQVNQNVKKEKKEEKEATKTTYGILLTMALLATAANVFSNLSLRYNTVR